VNGPGHGSDAAGTVRAVVSLTSTFVQADDVVVRTLGEHTVLMHLGLDQYFSLDGVGSAAWVHIADGRSLGATIDTIVEEYGEDAARVTADLVALIDDMVGAGLLIEQPGV
jgi:hypothetical protein